MSSARDIADNLLKVERDELLDPKVRVRDEGVSRPRLIPVSRNDQAKHTEGRQLVDKANVTEAGLAFLRPYAERLRAPLPSDLASNGAKDMEVGLDKLRLGCPRLGISQRVYVFLINLMPKKLVG